MIATACICTVVWLDVSAAWRRPVRLAVREWNRAIPGSVRVTHDLSEADTIIRSRGDYPGEWLGLMIPRAGGHHTVRLHENCGLWCGPVDRRIVVTHELGHVLGFEHRTDGSSMDVSNPSVRGVSK